MKFTKKFKENMINTTKIKSYIGFAIRMRKATFGVEGIKTSLSSGTITFAVLSSS
mgnify:CR=1 FL=1